MVNLQPEWVASFTGIRTLQSVNIMAFNISIENKGSKGAKNVRILVNIPEQSIIESFEFQVSEPYAYCEPHLSLNLEIS